MTYQYDPNKNRRDDISDDITSTHWIIGGVMAFAMVIAALAFTSTGNYSDWPQTNTTSAARAPPPNSGHSAATVACPRWAMCGRLRVGKNFLHVCSIGRCSHVFGLFMRFT